MHRTECGEIMAPQEVPASRPDSINMHGPGNPPGPVHFKGKGGWSDNQSISVGSFNRCVAGVECLTGTGDTQDSDPFWPEMGVHGMCQSAGFPAVLQVKMGDLALCMNTGIRASRTMNRNILTAQ